MLAKFQIELPFEVAVPPDHKHDPIKYHEGDCAVRIDAPYNLSESKPYHWFGGIQFDGQPCQVADILTVWFEKPSFARTLNQSLEPSDATLQRALDEFVNRIRFIAEFSQAQRFVFSNAKWKITYLNDDLSALEKVEGLVRTRSGGEFNYTTVVCDDELWTAMRSLPNDFEAPAWHDIFLDAKACLPHIGSGVVLAATSLELFISDVLDRLVTSSAVPAELWGWINKPRSNNPLVDEQFDTLLHVLCGHSLKEDNKLWQAFMNLKNARNNYVHGGIARISHNAPQLSIEDATALILHARKIIERVTLWLPEKYRAPFFVRNDPRGERTIITMRPSGLDPNASFQLELKAGTQVVAIPRRTNYVSWSQ